MDHRIVNRIIIEDQQVFIMDAPCDMRPLRFLRRVEDCYTEAFLEGGLSGLMKAIAEDVYDGKIHLRAGSMVTRAVRRGLHAVGLEQYQGMEKQQAVKMLAAIAEKVMLNWEYDPSQDIFCLNEGSEQMSKD